MDGLTLYDRIARARELLDLPERATLTQIRSNYRRLVRKWHPDRCAEDAEKGKEMTARIIMDYCNNYRYSFSREEVARYLSPEEWWRERFGP